MASLTNKNLDFLSNDKLVKILRSLLEEIDVVSSYGAHRSTTYLAVSAIEGLFGDLLKLLDLNSTNVPHGSWPSYNGKPKKPNQLDLSETIKIFEAAQKLPKEFEKLYDIVRDYRNYMHPAKELRDLKSINQSVGLLAIACLDALIEKYQAVRFVAKQEWKLEYGLARVPTDNVIDMPQNPGDPVSLLVSELPAKSIQQIKFRVRIPPNSTFNFVYSYFSLDHFMAARIEGRWTTDGSSFDNGLVHCAKWRAWSISGRYKNEPDPKQREHIVQIDLDTSLPFLITVDGNQLQLNDGAEWNFDPEGKVGFMTEWGLISILDLGFNVR